ncbi:fumarate hydratase [Pyrodictium occultum]|uniref:fumarate hydratase n=1 Tax=Pyrodictium occultum TaxID=2309 RepID=UPI003B837848
MGLGLEDRLRGFLVELIRLATTRLPRDVYEALERALEAEDNPLARMQLEAILENSRLAARLGRPICQDTGAPFFYLRVGDGFPLRSRLYDVAREAVREATRTVPLRPNAVDPLRGRNSGDNTGRYTPWVEVELVPGESLEAVYAPKGGGSEAPTGLYMALPLEGVGAVHRAVLETVAGAGPRACPPFVVGVGVAATGDQALALAKRALLLRRLGERHPDPEAAELEEKLLREVNELGLGAHGFGGRVTALDLHLEYGHRHPATYAVGVVLSCWALRRASGVFMPDGSWRITSSHI